ncbi:hypothetical protein NBT05_07050 [Aquimarina sp. ERC-38]|uniref:hypothetical protein n=1 Tax=Aquimarina sp. ERC-38 TaxID=2949996 RepID=UPI002246DD93|nr:hypothetical protein [Aquimarina sp. ERC-38]UZO82225.1 hypothetical protein NBT05_07050 [Aquimarina sp. ERC-38]
MIYKIPLILLLLVTLVTNSQNFSTDGHMIRNAEIATVSGNSVFYFSELSGSISLYSLEGKKIWEYQTQTPAVIFEIKAVDITNDQNDDVLVASGDGTIYALSSSGQLLWAFNPGHKVRFSEIAVVNNNNQIQVFAGGNDYKLYELDDQGQLVSTTTIKGVVRKIEAGNFLEANKPCLFLLTYNHDKYRWEFMGFLDAETKQVIKQTSFKNDKLKEVKQSMITDIKVADLDGDNKDDLLLFNDLNFLAQCIGINGNFDIITNFKASNKEKQRYAHSKGVFLANRKEIVLQHGGILFVLDNKGNLIARNGTRYGSPVHNDFVFDQRSNQLVATGEVDGGNGVYFYNTLKDKWWQQNHPLQGRMLEVAQNLTTLYQQTLNFTLPDYQKKSNRDWVMITSKKVNPKVKNLKGGTLKFVVQKSPKENTDRSSLVKIIGKSALKRDKRGNYNDSREDIVKTAIEYEKKGQAFTFWAGHGNDPFYLQIETMEKVLEVAPTTCYGFIYAEMDNTEDPRVVHLVNEYMPRLAKAIRKNNKAKVYFRYKNMFWAATSHLPLWKNLFFSGKYKDFLIPASEDTSNRVQDLNLAGRIGMHSGGYVDDFAMRLVDDNPTSWRPLSPGGQNSISPYLRQGVAMASYGARYGIILDNSFTKGEGLDILFALMKSGVLPVVERENIQSISSWHLIKDVDEDLIHSVDNHHNLMQYKSDDDNAVFSVAQMHWAGASVPENDFSNIGLGVKYRWLNYIPELPNGMVPIAPVESKSFVESQKLPYFISNGKVGFDNGNKINAKTFSKTIENNVEEGKKKLPILVNGAFWSAIEIDQNHTRIVLVDQGYLDPQDRAVRIRFQTKQPVAVQDILSKETLKPIDKIIALTVPAGSMRFVDVTY